LAPSVFPAAAEAGFEKSFAQLEGGALTAGAGSAATDSGSVGFSETSAATVCSGALSVATSPFVGFSARAGLASLVLALGSDGRAGAGTAEERVAGRFVAVEVALVAVLVRDRCWTGAAGVSEDWRGVAAASDGAVDVAGVRAETEGSVELASGTLACSAATLC
jgi:hypothetical protein